MALAGGRRGPTLEQIRRFAHADENVMVAMRDGVKLATDVIRPRDDKPHPVIFIRTPYQKRITSGLNLLRLGCAVVNQDCRGRYGSEGEFGVFENEEPDAFDTIAWIAKQPWCDGSVGMTGGSYVGYTQLAAALSQPPALKCIVPTVPPSNFEEGTGFVGGALRQSLFQDWLLGQAWRSRRVMLKQAPQDELTRWQPHRDASKWRWHLPLSDAGPIAVGGPSYAKAWTDAITNWETEGYRKHLSPGLQPEKILVPTLIIAGYYDIFAQENIDLALAIRARGGSELARKHSHVVIGPWVHGVGRAAGDVDYPKAHAMLKGLADRWFQRWLSGVKSDVDDLPAIRTFVMGQDRWLDTDVWPPKDAVLTRLHLGKGTLAEGPSAAGTPPTSFIYDPANPVPTVGGCTLSLPKGVKDHRKVAERPDVLTFLTEPLEADKVVVGPLRAHLFVSSDAADTDFTAMLLDVRPDGYRANIQDGIVRLRYRNGRHKPDLVKPGAVVEVDISLWSTSYVFPKGHRIALHVSSSNFPRFDRSLNDAAPPHSWTTARKATNTVYHDAEHPSFVELPVLPQ